MQLIFRMFSYNYNQYVIKKDYITTIVFWMNQHYIIKTIIYYNDFRSKNKSPLKQEGYYMLFYMVYV
ncbi:hypothetical protein X953_11775 [Virgibacillus sp. SK37]|nr:hypothetical protein X953_11775 [Virgibacillus sp. SK37]